MSPGPSPMFDRRSFKGTAPLGRPSLFHGRWTILTAILLTIGGLAVVLHLVTDRMAGSQGETTWMVPRADGDAVRQSVANYYQALQRGSPAEALKHAMLPAPDDAALRAAASWLIPSMVAQEAASRQALQECADRVQSLGWSVEQWAADRDDTVMPSSLQQLVPEYFKVLPTCPTAGGPAYTYQYSDRTGCFTVACRGKTHATLGVAPGFPEYSSRFGLTVKQTATGPAPPRLLGFDIQELSLGWRRATVRVRERLQVLGQERSATSALVLERVGDRWFLSRPDVGPPPSQKVGEWAAARLKGLGLGEAWLQALSLAPLALHEAAASTSNLKACGHNLEAVAAALDAYASDHDGSYPARLEQLLPQYARVLPTCPVDGGSYSEGYRADAAGYTLACPGSRHAAAGVPAGYPRLDAEHGLSLGRPGGWK